MADPEKTKEEVVEEKEKGTEDLKEEEAKDGAGDETKPAGGDKDTPADDDKPGEEGGEDGAGDAFTVGMLQEAASFGFDEAAARAFGTAENLQTACAGLDTKLVEMGRKGAAEDEEERRPAPKPRTIPSRAVKKDEEPPEKFKVELGEDVDPGIAKAMNAVVDRLNTKVAGLEGKLADTEQYVLDQEARAFRTQMDTLFAGLDDKWADTFGKETGNKLGANSPQLKNRLKVLDTCSALARGMEMTGQELPSEKALLERAIRADFGSNQEAMTRKALSASAKKRSRQISSRPTSRRGKLSGRDAAIAKSKEYDKAHDEGV